MEYYILSLKHSPRDGLCVWWRPDNIGYTTELEEAGRYTLEQIDAQRDYYDNNKTTRAVPVISAGNLSHTVVAWIPVKYEGENE